MKTRKSNGEISLEVINSKAQFEEKKPSTVAANSSASSEQHNLVFFAMINILDTGKFHFREKKI